ncbi:MAG: arylesterase [Clostridiales bacterium]|nr:arylesterase [Clostridiales bacterium]
MRTILAFGDSNTWGLVPGSMPERRYPQDVRWTGVLQSLSPDLRIIEEGLCGRTTVFEDAFRPGRNGAAALPFILESQSPLDGAILMLGTNDCKSVYRSSAYTIGKGIERCLDELEKFLLPPQILLVSPIHLGEHVYLPSKDPEFDRRSVEVSRELREVYQRIAQRRGSAFVAASDFVQASEVDDEHMDEAGHYVFAKAVLEKMGTYAVLKK